MTNPITRRLFFGSAPALAGLGGVAAAASAPLPTNLTDAICQWQRECRIADEMQAILRSHKGDTVERDDAEARWKAQYEIREQALQAMIRECAGFTRA